jgi:NTP pyrophosphatase (non-canonical NTP hydrolase)
MKKIETLAEYQQLASRTCPDLGSEKLNLFHMNSGIVTEIGEAIDPIKKHIAYGKELDLVNVGEEIADACWYIANKARLFLNEKTNKELWSEEIFKNCIKDFESQGDLEIKDLFDVTEVLHTISSQIATLVKLNQVETFIERDSVGIDSMTLLFKVAEFLKLDFWQLLTNNIQKLQIRYPEKFSNESALNRNLEEERKVLEQ